MKAIAVIPARGGSKRIPRKNIKLFFEKPIITYAIENALSSKLFSEVVVSTDDAEIRKIAEAAGAKCYWIRSEELSNDNASTLSVMQDAVQQLRNKDFEFVCCIYPSTPLLTPSDLISGFEKIIKEEWDYVISATKLDHNPLRSFFWKENGQVELLFKENELIRTQCLPDVYKDAGQFYWGKRSSWEKGKPIFTSKTTVTVFNFNHIIDIDVLEDWAKAEQMYSERLGWDNGKKI